MTAIIASSPNAIISMDLDGTIETWNEAATETFGYTAEEAIGRSISMIVPGEREDQLQQALATLRKGQSVGPIETTRVRRDGTPFDAIVSGSPIRGEDGTIVGVAGTIVDVTDRKKLNAQLRQAQKMETVGTLAGGVAHDFNNILHSSAAYLQMALDELPPESPVRELLERSQKGLDRAEDLVGKLLTFSRRERTTMTEVNLAAVVQETIDLTRPSLPDCVQLETSLCEACCQGCTVHGDAGQLQQVVMNLVTNAIQAMAADDPGCSQGGILNVDVRTTTVDDPADRCLTVKPGPYVCVTVSDTGPGMDRETKARVFEPFFTTKKTGEGTGLGLSVVHGIVQSHEGGHSCFVSARRRNDVRSVHPTSTRNDECSRGTGRVGMTSVDRLGPGRRAAGARGRRKTFGRRRVYRVNGRGGNAAALATTHALPNRLNRDP